MLEEGWTIGTSREDILARIEGNDKRYEQRFAAQETAVSAALLSAEKAVTKAETATENRLILLNELRTGVATKEQMDALSTRLSDMKERQDKLEGRGTGASALWGYVVGAVGFVVALVSLYLMLTGRK